MELTTVTRICYVGRPKCERGAYQTHGLDDSYTNLPRRTSKMRAWRASNAWNGRQLQESATSGIQNASVGRFQRMEWTTVTRICCVGRPKCERGARLTHGMDDSYTNLSRQTSKMRAWCASNAWNGRHSYESATSGVQNVSVVRI